MKFDALTAYQLNPQVIEVWKQAYGEELLPVQEQAVHRGVLMGKSLVVFSPTSSGKTFVGEMAAARGALAGGRVFYLVPLKALAEEKFEQFRSRYGPLGASVVLSTRDHSQYDAAITREKFHICVAVYEKLQSLLVSRSDLIEGVGLVVVDELQMIADPTRGGKLEVLLTKIRQAQKKPQFLGLSAVLEKGAPLAEWLGAELLVDKTRPVELKKGVVLGDTFQFREHNSGRAGEERILSGTEENSDELGLEVVRELAVSKKESVLIFVPDVASTIASAKRIAGHLSLPPARKALETLGSLERSALQGALVECLSHSVAFHNAELPREYRLLVERAFRTGEIRVLVATSTLAMGMNLPVDNVILSPRKWIMDPSYRRWRLVPLTKHEFENMAGRAGRLGLSRRPGRAMFVETSYIESEVLKKRYLDREFEELLPALAGQPLEEQVLNLVASKVARSRQELADFLLGSYSGWLYWSKEVGREAFSLEVGKAVDRCLAGEVFRPARRSPDGNRDEGGKRHLPAPPPAQQARQAGPESEELEATDLGVVAASKGLFVETAIRMARWAREYRDREPHDLEVLLFLSSTRDGQEFYVRFDLSEVRDNVYGHLLCETAERLRLKESPVVRPYLEPPRRLEREEAAAVKRALIALDWIEEQEIEALEAHYKVWAGAIARVAEDLGWLVDALREVAATCGWSEERRRELRTLSIRLGLGVRSELAQLLPEKIPGIGRGYLSRLYQGGFRERREVLEATEADLAKALGNRRAATILYGHLHGAEPQTEGVDLLAKATASWLKGRRKPPVAPRAADKEAVRLAVEPPRTKPTVRLVLRSIPGRRGRFRILADGREVSIRAREFEIALLFARALKRRQPWVPSKRIASHSATARKALCRFREVFAQALGVHPERLFEQDGAGRYRLTLHPDEVRVQMRKKGSLRATARPQLVQ